MLKPRQVQPTGGVFDSRPLRPRHRRILAAMQTGAVLTRDDLMAICWPNQDPPEWCLNVIKVELHRLRRAIAQQGLRIRNRYGQGWYLDPAPAGAIQGRIRQGGEAA